MKTAAVCIPVSGVQIKRLKALYPALKEGILKRHLNFDETMFVDWVETLDFILNQNQNRDVVQILINTLLTYEEKHCDSADALEYTE